MHGLFRSLFKDIAIYGAGDFLLRATAFITLPVYTRIFNREDYGIWSFIATVIGLLSAILILGGDSAYARFFFEAKSLREKQVVTSTWFSFLALWSGAVIVLCLLLARLFSRWSFDTEQHSSLFVFALLAAPFSMINMLCGQVLRNQFRPQLFITLNVLSTLLSVGCSLFAVIVLKLGLTGVFAGALLATVVMLPVRLWTVRTMLCPAFSADVLWQLLVFGVPLVPVSLAYWVFASSDRLVLGKLSTLEQLGLYAVANNITSALGFIVSALGQAWTPHAIRIYEEHPQDAAVFCGQMLTYLLVGFGLLCVVITVFAPEVLMVLSTSTFYPAALAIGPLALGFMAYASTQITALAISLSKKTYYFTLYSSLAAGLNVVLNVLLVPKWGMMASSWATTLSYVFLTVAYLITSQRLWPVAYEKRRGFMVVALTLAFTVAVPFLPDFGLLPGLAVKSIYCLGYILLLAIFRVLDQREWNGALAVLRGLQAARLGEAA